MAKKTNFEVSGKKYKIVGKGIFMKKLFSITLFIIICLITNVCLSFSNNYFETTILDNFKYSDNSNKHPDGIKSYMFTNTNEDNIVVMVVPHNEKTSNYEYSQSKINMFVDEMKNTIKTQFGSEITIISKTTSSFGVGDYNSLLLESKINDYSLFQKQYSTVSDKYIFSITLSSFDNNFFKTSEVLNFLKTFHIKDSITTTSLPDKMLNTGINGALKSAILGGLVLFIAGVLYYFRRKKL